MGVKNDTIVRREWVLWCLETSSNVKRRKDFNWSSGSSCAPTEESEDDFEMGGFEFFSMINRLKNNEEMSSVRLLL